MAGVVAKKQPPKQSIRLEYTFDRLLDAKLAQVYEVLVPDKAWPTNEQPSDRDGRQLNESSSDLCTSLIGPAERREYHREPDGGVDRVGAKDGIHDSAGMDLRRRRL